MSARKRHKTSPDISQRISCRKQPYSQPQRVSCLGQQSTVSDSDHQPGHQTVTQGASRKRPRSIQPSSQPSSQKKQPYSHPQRASCLGQQSTVSDSDHQPGHQTVTQGANRKRPRSSTSQSAPTTSTTSGISQKRKRDGSDNNSVKRTPAQELDDEVSILIGSNETTCAETPEGAFRSKYAVGEQLGSGGFGSVYAGTRKSDGEKVAIKFLLKRRAVKCFSAQFDCWYGPLEVGLMTLASQPEQCPNIIKLLDWYDCDKLYALVLECPSPCADLHEFMEVFGGPFDEMEAKMIMQQLVNALIRCRDQGVFHRDLKTKNVLINVADYTVKLIDFGCGDLMRDVYTRFAGTRSYAPPEWFLHECYRASPTTTWTLGILLFELVCGFMPFKTPWGITRNQPKFVEGLSEECKNLINWCLRKEAGERPTLEGILAHEWMTTNLSS